MPKRTDTNQAEIVKALRGMGATVLDLHTVGKGCPDLAVGSMGVTYLIEIKRGPKEKLTKDQEYFFRDWKGEITIIYSVEMAIDWLQKVTKKRLVTLLNE